MWLYLIPVLLALVVLLCRVPSHVGTLAPRSGRSWKAYLAYGLIKAGARKKLKENKIISPKDHEKMVPNPECDKNWNNSFVFTATNPNEDGDPQLLYSRKVEVTLILVTPKETLVIPCETSAASGDSVEANGLKFECLEPEKKWRISYSGKMLSYGTNHLGSHNVPPTAKKGEENENQVEIDFEWVSTTKTYHSGRDLDQWSSAVSMSEMSWSKEYFNNLKSENQTRIEQGGTVQGRLSINGKKNVNWSGVRDHSWGRRNYDFINCFCQNMIAFEEPLQPGGPKFTHLSWISVDYGSAFRALVAGWLAGADELLPLSEATDMAYVGDGKKEKIPPKLKLQFRPKGGPLLDMQVDLLGSYNFSLSHQNYKESDYLASIKVTGGVKCVTGRGLCAFGSKNKW